MNCKGEIKKVPVPFSNVLILVGLYLIISIMIVELVFRLNLKYPVSCIVYDKNFGWKYKKGKRTVTVEDNKQKITFNSCGFRDMEHSVKKESEKERIILLGDSYAAGTGVLDDEIFPRIFEKKLNKKGNNTYEIINAAVAAWATDQQLIYMKKEGFVKYDPDYVILAAVPNDIREAYSKKFFSIGKDNILKQNSRQKLSWKTRFCWYLSNHLCVYQWLQKKLNTNYGSFKSIFHLFPVSFLIERETCHDKHLFLIEEPPELKAAFDLFRAMLLRLNRLCLDNNCRLILTVLPTKMEYEKLLTEEKIFQPGKIAKYVKDIAIDNNIIYFNLWDLAAKEEAPLKLFIENEYHFNRTGHIFIAENLSKLFESSKKQ